MKAIDWVRWGVVTLAVLAVVLGIFAAFNREPAKPLRACFGSSQYGVTAYDDPKCDPVVWQHVPIVVSAYTINPHPVDDPAAATRRAIRYINYQIGFALFLYNERGNVDTVVAIGDALEVDATVLRDPLGSVTHMKDPEGLSARVATFNTGTVDVLDRVLVHELLHVAGVGHGTGVMQPADRGSKKISTAVRDMLRELYGPR